MATVAVPQGAFDLCRYPEREGDPLRAWDAADEYLLQHLADQGFPPDATVLIVNDGWGALATALSSHRPSSLSDSYLAHLATEANLIRNGIGIDTVTGLSSLDPLPERIDVAVVKVPKSLSLLEHQLHQLAPLLHEGSVIVGAAMAKHVHRSTLELFERIVGPTRTSLARKKARLVFGHRDPAVDAAPSPWPVSYTLSPGGETVVDHAGVFSAGQLDIGTRFLLEHLPAGRGKSSVVDLGCGNGVLGTMLALANPEATLTFVDESYLAVASAEATFRANAGADRPARFVVGNGLFELADEPPLATASVDLVLNNPPFHRSHAVGDDTAWQMFTESRTALRAGGELWVVGNRHLGYHAKLRRLFGNADVIASNSKFVVLRATR